MSTTCNGTPRFAAASTKPETSGGAPRKRSSTNPRPNRSSVERSRFSQTCGRAMTGPRGLHVARDVVARLGAVLAHDDGRMLVAETQLHADGEPFRRHHARVPVAVGLARPLAFRAGAEDGFRRALFARLEHAREVARGFLHVERRDGLALDLVGLEQTRAAPSFDRALAASRRCPPPPGCRCSCRSRPWAKAGAPSRRQGKCASCRSFPRPVPRAATAWSRGS